jgi:serine/threonine protein kinase
VKTQAECLTVDAIANYLHGDLSNAQTEQFEEHVQDCSGCLATLSSEAAKNPFFQAALSAGKYPDEVHASAALRAKLKSMRSTIAEASPHTPPVADAKGPHRPVNVADFLAPAQSAGELGRLEHYRILDILGHGGMGLVFRAEDTRLGRQVAIKVMLPEFARDAEARSRFLREARNAAAVEHDNIVHINHVGEERAFPYFVMPLLRGQSLDKRLRGGPPVNVTEALRIGRDLARGLAAAHAQGLIHRDIKPANIWLETKEEGERMKEEAKKTASFLLLAPSSFQVKILDFGLARQDEIPTHHDEPLTMPGAVLGTPAYMSPEQARGEPVDFRSDLYSAGVVLYQLIAGRLPFSAKSAPGFIVAHATETPTDLRKLQPALAPLVADTIMQLLEKDPARRPVSAQAVADTLDQLLQAVTFPTAAYAPTKAVRPLAKHRRRLVLSAVALLAASVLAGGLFFAFQPDPENPTPGPGPKPTTSLPPTPIAYHGSVDILVWRTLGNEARHLRLTDLGALPLMPGDQIRLTAHIQPAAFVYLFWIDEEGKAAPVYPWEPGHWGTRPPKETPVPALDLPKQSIQGFTIAPGREGMETLIMLALDSPLTASDADLQHCLGGLPPQYPV